jgi:hypothetical protein
MLFSSGWPECVLIAYSGFFCVGGVNPVDVVRQTHDALEAGESEVLADADIPRRFEAEQRTAMCGPRLAFFCFRRTGTTLSGGVLRLDRLQR